MKFKIDENLPIEVAEMLQQDKHTVLAIFKRLLKALSSEPLEKHLWIVDENRIRIRK